MPDGGERPRGQGHAITPRTAAAIAESDIGAGDLLARTATGTVEPAGDESFIVGIALHSAETGGIVNMQTAGRVIVRARSGASWSATDKVRANSSAEADEGGTARHYLGRLLYHDATNSRAHVALDCGGPTVNEAGELENDLEFDGALLARRYALLVGA